MPLYRVEVQVCATAYIKADSAQDAFRIAGRLEHKSPDIENSDGTVAVSGLAYDSPGLPAVSLSPAMTIHGVWPGATPEMVMK